MIRRNHGEHRLTRAALAVGCEPGTGRRRRGPRLRGRQRHMDRGQGAEGVGRHRNGQGLARRDHVVRVGHDRLHAQFGVQLVDHAPGHAVGIAVVAVDPHLHAVLLQLVHRDLHQLEIFGREVLHRPAAAVDHVHGAAVVRGVVDVGDDPLLRRGKAGRPVDRAVFLRRRGKGRGRFGHGGNDDFLP